MAVQEHLRGYCLHCFAHIFPGEQISRNYLVKERAFRAAVEAFLKNYFPHLFASFNKTVHGGCSARRPDIFIDALTHAVFGEVDEYGHNAKDYCACENKRMMLLMRDIGMRPTVFVRVNPDAFTDSRGTRHPSCFKVSPRSGRLVVGNQQELNFRVQTFLERIKHHLDNVPDVELQVEHLFYDGFVV